MVWMFGLKTDFLLATPSTYSMSSITLAAGAVLVVVVVITIGS